MSPESDVLDDIWIVTLGDNSIVDTRNIAVVTVDKSTSEIRLQFKNGKSMDIHTDRFDEDMDTLETCGTQY